MSIKSSSAVSEREKLEEIFKAVIAAGSLNTGVFGLRMQRESFAFFVQKLCVLHPGHSSDSERLQAAFGRTAFIHLKRLDKVEQAVSWVKAEQTGLWHMAADGTELERNSPPREPTYDRDRISSCITKATMLDQHWESWFATESIAPLRITYETLSAQPTDVLRRILDHMGVDSGIANRVQPGVAKLADEASREWVTRYRFD